MTHWPTVNTWDIVWLLTYTDVTYGLSPCWAFQSELPPLHFNAQKDAPNSFDLFTHWPISISKQFRSCFYTGVWQTEATWSSFPRKFACTYSPIPRVINDYTDTLIRDAAPSRRSQAHRTQSRSVRCWLPAVDGFDADQNSFWEKFWSRI